MAAETLRYLKEEGRGRSWSPTAHADKAEEVAARMRRPGPRLRTARPMARRGRRDRQHDGGHPSAGRPRTFSSGPEKSGGKPVVILDLGVPRDFEPAVHDIDDDVFLYSIDDLQAVCDREPGVAVA